MTKKLKRLLEAYVNARIAKSWRGSMSPEAWLELEAQLKRTRNKLYKHLRELCATAGALRE
jgi:hypothetical protein